ncbi:MAG: class I SAM-dependent methyltransferase [Caldilineaceae bacterium]
MELTTYGRLAALEYALDNEAPPADYFDFYWQQYTAVGVDGPVLEPMCGAGRFLLPFLVRGVEIDGMDASEHMLTACRDRCAGQGFAPNLYHQLIQEIELPRQYAYIFMPDRAIGLLYEKAVVQETLQRLYDHLLSGGVLAVDVQSPGAQDFLTGVWQGGWTDLPDGSKLVHTLLFELEEDRRILRAIGKHERFVNGKLQEAELDTYTERLYFRTEFSTLLEDAGFVDIEMSRPFNDPKPEGPGNIAFVCRKSE